MSSMPKEKQYEDRDEEAKQQFRIQARISKKEWIGMKPE
jgi:hypothetical protein